MFRMHQSTLEAGDCTCGYRIVLDKIYTVEEFVNTVISEKPKEWGYIGINDGKSIFGNPQCEYRCGNLKNKLPDDILRKKVVSVSASGGWTRMDYLICLE